MTKKETIRLVTNMNRIFHEVRERALAYKPPLVRRILTRRAAPTDIMVFRNSFVGNDTMLCALIVNHDVPSAVQNFISDEITRELKEFGFDSEGKLIVRSERLCIVVNVIDADGATIYGLNVFALSRP